MADAVGPTDCGDVVPLVHHDGCSHILNNFRRVSDTVEGNPRRLEECSGQLGGLALVINHQTKKLAGVSLGANDPADHAYGVFGSRKHIGSLAWAIGPDAHHKVAFGLLSDNGDATGVHSTVGHGLQHTNELVTNRGESA